MVFAPLAIYSMNNKELKTYYSRSKLYLRGIKCVCRTVGTLVVKYARDT